MTKPTSTTTGTIIRHGEAPYQHDPDNSLNYFVEVEIEKDKYETLWGVNLKELVESQQLEVGEKASFHKFKQETGANKWEVARYFEVEKLENSIERDFSQEKLTEPVSEFGQSKVKQSADYTTDDAEYIVPNAIRNRYLSVAVNQHTDSPMVKFYERENPAAVAFEDRGDKGLHTSKSDKDTIKAMLDMAQSKGWESIKLKGSEEFKREAWMEAQMRGIKTKGYEPNDKDKLELQARQEERASNQIEATKIGTVYTKEADKTGLDHAKDAGIAVGTSVAMGDNFTAATAVQAIVTDKVQSLAADVVIDQHEQTTETEFQQDQSAEVADVPAPTTEQETSSSLSWAIDDLKKVVGEEETTKILNEIDNDLAAIQPDYELADKHLKKYQEDLQRVLKEVEEENVKVETFDEWLTRMNLDSTPESRIQAEVEGKINQYKIDAIRIAEKSANELADKSRIEAYISSIAQYREEIPSLKAQQEMGGVTAQDVYDYTAYVRGEVGEVQIQKMQEEHEYEDDYDPYDDLLDAFDTDEYRIEQAEMQAEMELAAFEARYNAEQKEVQTTELVSDLHNYNISINQDMLDNALAMKEKHYERGYTSEREVLSDNYFVIDSKNDFYIANQLNTDVSEFKNHHYAIDKTSDIYFIKQMVNELNISDDVKRDFELKFSNRMTEQLYANDGYDMPHENFSLRNYAVLARSDLEQSLNKFNEPNRDLVIKSFDGLMVDYSKQVVAHQKSWLLSRANSEVALEPKKRDDFKENLEKMLRESQAADQSTKTIHPSMQQAEEKFKSYFGEEKATEFLSIIDKEIAEIEPDYELAAKNLKYAQANTNVALKRAEEFGVQVDSLDEWLAKRNLESMPESRIQADIDSAVHNYRISSMDSIQHLTLSKNDERTMRSIETNLFKIASLKAQQEMGGATVRDIYDYNNYVYDAAVDAEVQKLNEDYDKGLSEEQDNEQDIDDNLLFEQYLEDLENGEIRSNTSWADYRDDWREAETEAAEQQHGLKEVETEAYVRAEEFQRGRDIDPDLDMNVAGEAEQFKSNVVSAPKVAGMTQAKVTQKVEAAFDRKIDSSMAATKRDDFKQDFEENKAKLSENDKVKVEAVRRVLDFLHKDNPTELQTGYEKLTTAMKNGEISKLPDVPQQVVQQSIEVQAPTQSNKDRGR